MNFSRNYSQAGFKKIKLITTNLMRGLVGRLVNLLRDCLVGRLVNLLRDCLVAQLINFSYFC
jgi:hypothetical protein